MANLEGQSHFVIMFLAIAPKWIVLYILTTFDQIAHFFFYQNVPSARLTPIAGGAENGFGSCVL